MTISKDSLSFIPMPSSSLQSMELALAYDEDAIRSFGRCEITNMSSFHDPHGNRTTVRIWNDPQRDSCMISVIFRIGNDLFSLDPVGLLKSRKQGDAIEPTLVIPPDHEIGILQAF